MNTAVQNHTMAVCLSAFLLLSAFSVHASVESGKLLNLSIELDNYIGGVKTTNSLNNDFNLIIENYLTSSPFNFILVDDKNVARLIIKGSKWREGSAEECRVSYRIDGLKLYLPEKTGQPYSDSNIATSYISGDERSASVSALDSLLDILKGYRPLGEQLQMVQETEYLDIHTLVKESGTGVRDTLKRILNNIAENQAATEAVLAESKKFGEALDAIERKMKQGGGRVSVKAMIPLMAAMMRDTETRITLDCAQEIENLKEQVRAIVIHVPPDSGGVSIEPGQFYKILSENGSIVYGHTAESQGVHFNSSMERIKCGTSKKYFKDDSNYHEVRAIAFNNTLHWIILKKCDAETLMAANNNDSGCIFKNGMVFVIPHAESSGSL